MYTEFWNAIDKSVRESEIVNYRAKGSVHSRQPNYHCKIDCGYLNNTSSMEDIF